MFTLEKGAANLDRAIAGLPADVRTSLLEFVKEAVPLAKRYARTWDVLAEHPALKDALLDLAMPIVTRMLKGKGGEALIEIVRSAPVLRAAVDEVAEFVGR